MNGRLLTGMQLLLFVPLGRDLMSGHTTAVFHCELKSPLSSDRLVIFIISGMQLCNTCLSSLLGLYLAHMI